MSMDKSTVLNASLALERLGGDTEIYDSLRKTFLEVYADDIEKSLKPVFSLPVSELFSDAEAAHVTHQLKGAALSIGAEKLGNLASEINNLLREQHTSTEQLIEQLTAMLNDLRKYYAQTRAALQA
ncbi:Hpt domain-containing protein [Treponema phagedenis]|nr:Hpt domain-containing protein [Treponema phagedenis]TYT78128.1 Hpt domain-containing protein [Treponema phagedenis]